MLITEKVKEKRSKHTELRANKQPLTIDPVDTALRVTVPAWPLQNTVAVNPFWDQRDQRFSEVMESLAPIHHVGLYMPLSYYLEAYQSGLIQTNALESALQDAKDNLKTVPESVEELVQLSKSDADYTRHVLSASEYVDQRSGTLWRDTLAQEVGKYAAAYFDRSQATVKFPWRDLGFWQAWLRASEHDLAMEKAGLTELRETILAFSNLSAKEVTKKIATYLKLESSPIWPCYLARLLTLHFGWASQFRYTAWQSSLGYPTEHISGAEELLAVALVYDFAVAKQFLLSDSQLRIAWTEGLKAATASDEHKPHFFQLHEIWQSAFEKSYQCRLGSQITPRPAPSKRPASQLAMCIDVRSEMYRRNMEAVSPATETIGFAGFFGVPFTYQKVDEAKPGNRLPVLLSPAFSVAEDSSDKATVKIKGQSYFQAFFRNLRKAPHASLLYVELFGIYSLRNIVRRFWDSFAPRKVPGAVPARFRYVGRTPSQKHVHINGQHAMDLASRIDRAGTVLRHMGLTKRFARLIVLAGHGSANENNAFMSSLDCGACGGHAGDINARFLADLLNDGDVRQGLITKGIEIPADTWFVAALHETVTDELYLLDDEKIPPSHQDDMNAFLSHATKAAEKTRKERQMARSRHLDPVPARRAVNWSEVRPEWGLAGNAAFIVAPRSWTLGANLASRTFLHDYDWRQDEGFKTLELIMTAPMVVTNWINMQYYASTVAPKVYGSGNKVLHNLVNESGVVEGNGGDLRIGLPWQSVHDGERFVHEPLRLSVFIAAPRDQIETIIKNHAVVRSLVDNEWLHILHLDDQLGTVSRRYPGGLYRPLEA